MKTLITLCVLTAPVIAEDAPDPKAPDWKTLGKSDFTGVNGSPDTWQWKEDGSLHCTGNPIGVLRTVREYKNFEMAISWSHQKPAGNSGVFVWAPKKAIEALTGPGLPKAGIEVQVLDPGFTEAYEKSSGKKGDWFTCHGDVFPVGESKMKPFPPLSPDGSRSFPTKQVTRPAGEWNHYLIRAVDGVVKLWVNGEQVSGGGNCEPSSGYLCLESEGSPIVFKDIRLREITP
ncbi:MAG: DUF1080 domain-containing protein [Verrucomicrobiaceae bacterium]|nr:MAG: DUF1080 domain-containing protein [Verrucomicrobiaceae bacterium]